MNIFIYVCILVINVMAVVIISKFLGKSINKKTKGIFIIVGLAAMYMLVSFVFWLSNKNLNVEVNSNMGKNLITFTFVPLNSIIILPFLAKSYRLVLEKKLNVDKFKNRCILFAVILLIILIIEFFYFKNIQTGILEIIKNSKNINS